MNFINDLLSYRRTWALLLFLSVGVFFTIIVSIEQRSLSWGVIFILAWLATMYTILQYGLYLKSEREKELDIKVEAGSHIPTVGKIITLTDGSVGVVKKIENRVITVQRLLR